MRVFKKEEKSYDMYTIFIIILIFYISYDWKIEEAQKNLLRTHTTAVSARMLYKLANRPEGFKAVKYFSIDKVFRNETLDATHLAEFHQVRNNYLLCLIY